MRKSNIFTESQLLLIGKIHKYSRIYQLLNIRSSEFYKYIHSSITLFIILVNLSIAIINFNLDFVNKNSMHNSIVLICNTIIISLDVLLSFQMKKEFHKNQSVLFNNLANNIEEDLMTEDVNSLEFNRIFNKFKTLLYAENQYIPKFILNKEQKNINYNQLELDNLLILDLNKIIL
jgi:hypothetical protein